MADPNPSGPPDSGSTRDLLFDWNLGDTDSLGDPGRSVPNSSHNRPTRSLHSAPGASSPIERLETSGESLDLQAGFGWDEPAAEWSIGGGGPEVVEDGARTRPNARAPKAPERDPAGTTRPTRELESGASRSTRPGQLPRAGEVVAGFRILRELGRGAFARVYLAEEVHLGRRLVAIKVSRPEGDEPQILARLQHTHIVPVHSVCDDPASGLRILCMPYFGGANLAQVLDAAGGLVPTERAGRSLIEALDQISGSRASIPGQPTVGPSQHRRSMVPDRPRPLPASLRGRPVTGGGSLERSGTTSGLRWFLSRFVGTGTARPGRHRVPEAGDFLHQPSRQFLHQATAIQAAVWIVARLAEGLDHAHSRGLLHRDLKPANILLAGDGTPMLLDFNLAADHRMEFPEGEVRQAAIGGTLPYMAPEHLDAFHPRGTTPPDAVDERADIYALGLVLFEMLADEAPFPAPPPGSSVIASIEFLIESRRQVPSLRARWQKIPWSLDALVTQCLQFDPARRFAGAGDLAEDLRRFLDNRPMKHCPEPSVRERLGKFARRHPGLCGSTSIALFSLILIGLLGTAVVLGYGAIQDLAARVRRPIWDREFAEVQFLLNTADTSDGYLKRGIARAVGAFAFLGLGEGRPSATPQAGWTRRLTPEEQVRLREQVLELTLLEARARVLLATKRGSEADRRQAIERAIARLDWAERVDSRVPGALFAERARYHAALGQAARADRDRHRAAETVPTTRHDWTLLGTTLLAGGDLPAAEAALKQALRLDVTSFWSWFVLGHCHFVQRRFLEAAGDFAVCAARGPDFAWVHLNRGLALARAGRLLDARDAYDRATAIEPGLAEPYVNRALVELELNRLEPALADLTRARELGRYDLAVLAAMGETLARLGRRPEAERLFDEGLAREPNNPVWRVARGMSLVRSDPAAARQDFLQALQVDPQHAGAHYGLALLIRKADPQGSLGHLDAALGADPHLIDAIQLRALVRARLGEQAALDDIDRLLECPTAHRLYNAACAVTLYAEKAHDTRRLTHALDLLARALGAGFPAAAAAGDPDLKALHSLPAFRRLIPRAGK